jgi:hypothetical protein
VNVKKLGDGSKGSHVIFSQAATHREAIVKRTARTTARPFRPEALSWVDFLVIAAIILTFAVIVSTTVRHARALDHNDPPTFSSEASQIANDPGLIKAKIRLAIGKPWS